MWLGSFRGRYDKPCDIKWVTCSKSLGIFYGTINTNRLNWIPCITKFKQSIFYHLNRYVSLFGKAQILNYIGYSKLWHKASALLIPNELCHKSDGSPINVSGNG